MMKLYIDPISTTCRPILMFLAEHSLPVEIITVSLFAGEHMSEAFVALNPNHAVPVFEEDGFVLTEVSAILKHLAEMAGTAYGAGPHDRSRTNQWMDWFNTGLYRDLGYNYVYVQTLPNYAFSNAVTQADVLARGAEGAAKWLAILDRHGLAGEAFLGGDTPSIADYLGAGYISLGDWVGFDLSSYPNVLRWISTMRARPGWAATHAPHEALAAHMRAATAQAA
jgi:glutathione S-transferase